MAKRSRPKAKQPAAIAPRAVVPTPAPRPTPAAKRLPEPTPAVVAPPLPGLLWPILLVVLVAVVIYVNGIPGDFVFDDKLIVRDPRIKGQESFWRIFVTDYWYKYFGTWADLYRPLTIASYALNFMVAGGLSSPAFHVVNIVLHAAVCAVIVLLIDAVLHDRPLAVVSGLLFAVHPIHTEAVTGIVGRAEILTALFLLAALYLHARHYTLRGVGAAVWMPVAGLAYFCALLSKETSIVGPGLLLLVDGVDRARALWEDRAPASLRRLLAVRRTRQTIAALAMYIGIAALFVFVRFLVVGRFLQRPPAKTYYLLFGHPLTTQLFTGFKILAIYLKLLFFPLTLSADYSYRQVVLSQSLDSGALVGMVAALCLVAAFTWALRARAVGLIFSLGFFAVAYSVVSNLIVPIGVLVAERLMYLPSVGFCAALAWAGLALSRRYLPAAAGGFAASGWLRYVPVGVLAVVLALYGVRTFVRNFDWRNHVALYGATVAAAPQCHAAHFNYAAVLMETRRGDRQAMDLALQELLKGYEIRQDHFPSLVNMTLIYMERGELEKGRDTALQGLKVSPNSKKMKGLLQSIENQLRQRQKG